VRPHFALRFLFAVGTILAAACDGGGAKGDAGADGAADAGIDAGADAGEDAGTDAGTGADAGADAGEDAGPVDTDSCGGAAVEADFELSDAGALEALSGVTHVVGSVTVSGPALVDLAPLASLRCVDGDLRVEDCPSLAHLTGLEGLLDVGGNLVVGWNGALVDTDGLASLGRIGGSIWLTANPSMGSARLPSLATLGSHLLVTECAALASVDLAALAATGGDLELSYCGALSSLAGLGALEAVGGDVSIEENASLPTCEADDLVAQLESFGGALCVQGNAADGCPDVTSGCD